MPASSGWGWGVVKGQGHGDAPLYSLMHASPGCSSQCLFQHQAKGNAKHHPDSVLEQHKQTSLLPRSLGCYQHSLESKLIPKPKLAAHRWQGQSSPCLQASPAELQMLLRDPGVRTEHLCWERGAGGGGKDVGLRKGLSA